MLGSPTWARTRDLRINSPTTEPGCKPRQCLFITLRCLILWRISWSDSPRNYWLVCRISDSSRDLVRRHYPALTRLYMALCRGWRIVTTQDLDLLERTPAIHMSVAPSDCCIAFALNLVR